MSESIIRRFAKYHGVNLCLRVPFTWVSSLAYALQVRGTIESDQETRDRVVAALTRIEDAEMLIAEAGAVTSVSDGPAFPRVRARLDILANELLVQAGIKDPQRWREVKE